MRTSQAVVAVLLMGIVFVLATLSEETNAQAGMSNETLIKRGEMLAMFGGCHDCHTPKIMTAKGPVPDATRLLSGHPSSEKLPPAPAGVVGPGRWGAVTNNNLTAWVGPWGTSFAANLTPDKKTGLGNWTLNMFSKAMRTGKHVGVGRPILPPMPWLSIAALSDQDMKALFAYLKSLKPISNPVPQPLPPS